jgi:hypothetical protein
MNILNPHTVIPDELKPGDVLGVKVVAVIGRTGRDWAAYEGLTNWDDQQVASHGDKISQSAAEALFSAPVIMGMKYRH